MPHLHGLRHFQRADSARFAHAFAEGIQSGAGIGSSQWTFDQAALGNIEETITTSIKTYESMIDGYEAREDVDAFIAHARKCFEA